MSFKPGDLAVVVRGPSFVVWEVYAAWIGRQVTVTGHARRAPTVSPSKWYQDAYPVECDGQTAWFIEDCLRKLPPPAQKARETLGEWELCPWRPDLVTSLNGTSR